ncbi:hypothetical protein [Moorena sp. SIO3H5]|uniref:hypothetical protein n=1 Tax=Moorena sp. SIO3H5 TaxID=2607834 RepID=UPI0013BE7EF5|nr:hypothetical protein [Moorena sp. SIO3H5]NEO69845.1 hypothetical protein [Moorena sp. SIO3H5]
MFSLLPLFPSWEGLGVGSCSLLPAPCSLQTQNFIPHKLQTAVLNSLRIVAL